MSKRPITPVILAIHAAFLALLLVQSGCRSPEVLQPRSYIPAPSSDGGSLDPGFAIESSTPPPAPVGDDFGMDISIPPEGEILMDDMAPGTDFSAKPITYTVKKGDSFWKIARIYGVSMQELAAENNMSLNKVLSVGTELRIPPGGALISEDELPPIKKTGRPAPPPTPSSYEPSTEDGTYVVKPGDSLWKIARTHGLKVSELAAANGLDPKKPIIVNQKLVIPGGGGATSYSEPEDSSFPDDFGMENDSEFTEGSPFGETEESAPTGMDESSEEEPTGSPDELLSDEELKKALEEIEQMESPAAGTDESKTGGTDPSTAFITHESLKDETLTSIANMYGVKIESVKKANPELPESQPLPAGTKVDIPEY